MKNWGLEWDEAVIKDAIVGVAAPRGNRAS